MGIWLRMKFFLLMLFLSTSCFAFSNAQEWASDNPWFGKNKEMTDYALKLHEEIIVNRETSTNSVQYYEILDTRLRARFPQIF